MDKYATSNLEIYNDILMRENHNPNVVTICTLKNILKGRAKRGDDDAFKYYCQYVIYRLTLNGLKMSDEEIIELVKDSVSSYFEESDPKKRDSNTAFEDFENKYFFVDYRKVS